MVAYKNHATIIIAEFVTAEYTAEWVVQIRERDQGRVLPFFTDLFDCRFGARFTASIFAIFLTKLVAEGGLEPPTHGL